MAFGANVIEKHFCISREIENPDSSFSMTPREFRRMVNAVRRAEAAVGIPTYGVSKQEESNVIFRRSLFVVKDMQPGEEFTKENVRSIRPGYGIKPKYMNEILGKKCNQAIKRGTPLSFDMIQ